MRYRVSRKMNRHGGILFAIKTIKNIATNYRYCQCKIYYILLLLLVNGAIKSWFYRIIFSTRSGLLPEGCPYVQHLKKSVEKFIEC